MLNSDPSRPVTLTGRGREQARALGKQLSNLDIDLAVATRFPRTRQTIEIALQGRQVPVVIDADLDEIRSGDLDGVPIEAYWSWQHHHSLNAQLPHGESVQEALHRYATAVRRLLDRTERVTFVVMHGLGLGSLVMSAAGVSSSAAERPTFGNAVPYLFDEGALSRSLSRLEALAASRRADS